MFERKYDVRMVWKRRQWERRAVLVIEKVYVRGMKLHFGNFDSQNKFAIIEEKQ